MNRVMQHTGVRVALVATFVAAVAAVAMPEQTTSPADAGPPSPDAADLRCRFEPGDRAAFRLTSEVEVQDASDRFAGTLSWDVVEATPEGARLRAAFSDVTLTQSLTLPAERIEAPEGQAFYVEIDDHCRLGSMAFSPVWNARTRQFVRAQLDNHAFALPEAGRARWEHDAMDGLGQYRAAFSSQATAHGVSVLRRKMNHQPHGLATAMGVKVAVHDSAANAQFDAARPGWWTSTEGREQATISAPGQPQVMMSQQFSLTRDDGRYAEVPALDLAAADGRDPYSLPVEGAHAPTETDAKSYAEAWRSFEDLLAATPPRDLDAAHALAAWLRAHPEDVARLVAALHAGEVGEAARPAFFLALELSGTDTARDALGALIDDERLSPLDQARAASALADLGDPTRAVADRLLDRAENTGDMAGRVSLLGLGSMLGRAKGDEDLHEHLVTSLLDRHHDAATETDVQLALDAMGNSGDPAFVDALGQELSAESPATRRHAAEALAKLPPEEASPRLVEQLRAESHPKVSTSLVRALAATGDRSPETVAMMTSRLQRGGSDERATIVDWLGQTAKGDPTARRLLAARFHQETDAALKQQIGRYLPADALR